MDKALATFLAVVVVVGLICCVLWLVWRSVRSWLWSAAKRKAVWVSSTYIDDDGDTVVRLQKIAKVGAVKKIVAQSLPLLKQQVNRVDDPALVTAELEGRMLADQRNAMSTSEY